MMQACKLIGLLLLKITIPMLVYYWLLIELANHIERKRRKQFKNHKKQKYDKD